MKVKRLIEQLQKMNPEAKVYIGDYGGSECLYLDTFYVNGVPDPETVWLQTEWDVDMTSEINAMFDTFIKENWDEVDGYQLMLDIGITPNIVRRNVGDEAADHMEKFMEEHGL